MTQRYSDTRPTDYIRPIYLARKVLTDANITIFPVSLRIILRHYGIRVMKYVDFCAANDTTMDKCLKMFGKDGATISNGGRYVIVYNHQATPKDRIRFTIAHELGHIFHRHHDELGVEVLQRLWVEKSLYDVMEDEANCFARNLLCPPLSTVDLFRLHGITATQFDEKQQRNVWLKISTSPCLPGTPDSIKDFVLVRQAFRITDQAAKTRCHFLKNDLMNLKPTDRKPPYTIKHGAQWRCTRCGALRLDGGMFCYECGARNQFGFVCRDDSPDLPAPVRYNGIHFQVCFFCGNTHMPQEARFCIICGMPATNPCLPTRLWAHTFYSSLSQLDPKTRHLCPPGIRFCPSCGSRTVFSESGIEDSFDFKEGSASDMNYGPSIPYDEDTMKITKCPRCLYDAHREESQFCIMCGLNLFNTCEQNHSNPPDARFCSICGEPTALYEASILKSYKEILKANADEATAEFQEMGLSIDELTSSEPAPSSDSVNSFDPDELPF